MNGKLVYAERQAHVMIIDASAQCLRHIHLVDLGLSGMSLHSPVKIPFVKAIAFSTWLVVLWLLHRAHPSQA